MAAFRQPGFRARRCYGFIRYDTMPQRLSFRLSADFARLRFCARGFRPVMPECCCYLLRFQHFPAHGTMAAFRQPGSRAGRSYGFIRCNTMPKRLSFRLSADFARSRFCARGFRPVMHMRSRRRLLRRSGRRLCYYHWCRSQFQCRRRNRFLRGRRS